MPDRPVRPVRFLKVVVDQDMLRSVPSTVAKVETAHEGDRLVDDAQLFVLMSARSLQDVRETSKTCRSGNVTVSAGRRYWDAVP